MNTALEHRPTLRARIRWKLFPSVGLPPLPNPTISGLPGWAADAIYVDNMVHLSFLDRLRVLVSGKVEVRSRTYVEVSPGRCVTESVAYPSL